MEIKAGFNTSVVHAPNGEMYSINTLKGYSKDDLIDMLMLAQHNYSNLLDAYANQTARFQDWMDKYGL